MSDGSKTPQDSKMWTVLDRAGREKNYFDNLALIARTPVAEFLDKVLPPEFEKYTWEPAECPRDKATVFYNTLDGEQGAGDGTIYQWYRAEETGDVFRVPYFQGKYPGLTEVFLNIMAKSKQLSPWSKIDSLIMEPGALNFEDSSTRFGLTGRSAVIKRAGLENTVAALTSEEYSQQERFEIIMDRVGQVSHESVHLNNEDTFLAMGNYRAIVEIGPEIIEMLCFAHNGCPPIFDLQRLIGSLEQGQFTELDSYQEAVGMGVILLMNEYDQESKIDSVDDILNILTKFRDRIAIEGKDYINELRSRAVGFALSVDNQAIIERLISMGVTNNRLGLIEQLVAPNDSMN